MVFNLLGSMFGGGIAGLIPFAVIFLVGHTLNLGINALGAYVHTLRLQYVELFSKFYEGGGLSLIHIFSLSKNYLPNSKMYKWGILMRRVTPHRGTPGEGSRRKTVPCTTHASY